ncbi:hypothetical protein RO3G_04052 [Rhizopus delemar RA 99-880]|uniref:Uncharacterized protein n=1 Tax=Rhizopus delemar (strain RA 99-880 / ATCC MYA-4621 / FGSC 9543 / NRRL 43880) TaxID=246409 RepID=I1BT17_RHIO9|nr:hypothetical protein RO3G_04052 [Rhizopus delemar RA 99-880]|eukprot:EIE79347.1 hypothetical protein RO3G_04052 [Rhizopus delemar RA 99-880]
MNSSPINPDGYFDQIYSIELIAFLSTVFNLIKVIILVVKVFKMLFETTQNNKAIQQ